MITTTKTLLSLACLISNKGTIDTSSLEAQLTQSEKMHIETVIQSGSCLPQNLEKLLRKSKESGIEIELQRHTPSEACFS